MGDPNQLSRAITSLPLPLAQTLRRAVNAKSPQEQHNGAYYFFESALKLAASAQVGVYLSVDCPDAQVNKVLESLTRPSVGQWLQVWREVARVLGGRKDTSLLPLAGVHERLTVKQPMPAAQAFLKFAAQASGGAENRTQLRVLDVLDGIVAYRNQELGHGAQRERGFYAEAAPLLVGAVLEALETARPFGELQLAVARDVLEGASQRAKRRYEILRGDGLHLPLEAQHPDDEKIAAGRLVLAAGNVRVQLHPLVVYEIDRMDRDRVGFLNQVATRGKGDTAQIKRVEYLDYDSGERLEAHDAVNELASLLSRVRGAKVSIETVDGMTRAEALIDDGTAAPDTGQWIGDFELVSELGRGGMGIVYEALQGSLKRHVALKVLPPGIAGDPIAVARFKREIAALGRCDHPNVVKVLTAGQEGDRHYYAMEYVEGSDLGQVFGVLSNWRLKSGGDLREGHLREAISSARSSRGAPSSAGSGRNAKAEPEPALPQKEAELPQIAEGRDYYTRIAEILADAARGVDHLHQHGIIHRDLKPGNIMLTGDGKRAVIMDLGLAQMQDRSLSLTASSVKILGTLRYMPPEQLQHNLLEVTPKADVYSLGATLYELAVLAPIFDGDSEAKLIAQVLQTEPRPPRSINSRVPRDLETIISVATAKNPSERYATAAHLADDLERFAKGEPIAAKPPSTFHYLKLFYRKNRGLVRTIAAAFVILVATVTVFVQQLASALASTEQQRKVAVDAEATARDALTLAEERQAEAERQRKSAEEQRKRAEDSAVAEAGARKDADEQRAVAQQKAEEAEKALLAANRNLARAYIERSRASAGKGEHLDAVAFMVEAYRRARGLGGDRLESETRNELSELEARAPLAVWETPVAPFWSDSGGAMLDRGWQVALTSEDQSLVVHDLISGQRLHTIPLAFEPIAFDIAPGGQVFALGRPDGGVEISATADGSRLAELKAGDSYIESLAFIDGGKSLATVSRERELCVWSTSDWSLRREYKAPEREFCQLKQGAEHAVIRTGENGGVQYLELLTTGKRAGPIATGVYLNASPDGRWLIGTDYTERHVQLWDMHAQPPAKRELKDMVASDFVFIPGTTRCFASAYNSAPWVLDCSTGEISLPFSEDTRLWGISVSPDGRYFIGFGPAPTVVCETESFKPVAASSAYSAPSPDLCVSPDGRWAAHIPNGRRLVLRDAATGDVVASHGVMAHHSAAIAWSPDSRWIAFIETGNVDAVATLDAAEGFANIHRVFMERPDAKSVAFVADGTGLVVGCVNHACVVAWPDGAVRHSFPLQHPENPGGRNAYVYASCTDDGSALHVMDDRGMMFGIEVATGNSQSHKPPADVQTIVDFDGTLARVLYTTNQGALRIWEPLVSAQSKLLYDPGDMTGDWKAKSRIRAWFTPDRERIVFANQHGELRLLNLVSNGSSLLFKLPNDVCVRACMVGEGNFVYTSHESGCIRLWRTARTTEASALHETGKEVLGMLLSPDGSRLYVCGMGADTYCLDTTTGERLATYTVPGTAGFVALALTPDGQSLVCGGAWSELDENGEPKSDRPVAGCIAVFQLSDGKLARTMRVPEQTIVFSVSLYADGKRLLSAGPAQGDHASPTGDVIEWNLESGERVRTVAQLPGLLACAFLSPDNMRVVTCEARGTLRILDATDGKILRTVDLSLSEFAFPCWDPSSRHVWVVDRRGQLLRISAEDDGLLSLGKGHSGSVITTRVSGDGRYAITAGEDRTIRMWDLVAGTPGALLHCPARQIVGTAISADGSRVFAAGRDGKVMSWNLSSAARVSALLADSSNEEDLAAWSRRRCGMLVDDLEITGYVQPRISWRWQTPDNKPAGDWATAEKPEWLQPKPRPRLTPKARDWFRGEVEDAKQTLKKVSLRWEAKFEGFRYIEETDAQGNTSRKPVPARNIDANGLPVGEAQGHIDYPAWYAAKGRDE